MAKLLASFLVGALARGLALEELVLDAQAVQLGSEASMSAEAVQARVASYMDEVSMSSDAAGSVDKVSESFHAEAVLDEISAEQQADSTAVNSAVIMDEAGAEQATPVATEAQAAGTESLVLDTMALQVGVEAAVEADMSKVYLDEVSLMTDSAGGSSGDTASVETAGQAVLDEISAEHSESNRDMASDQEPNVAPVSLRTGLGETRDIIILDTMAMQVNIQEGAVDKSSNLVDQAVEKSQAVGLAQVDKAETGAEAAATVEEGSAAYLSDQAAMAGPIVDEVGMENDQQGSDANDPFGNLFQVGP